MKKILLATTALVGFAGAAAAEVALSGYAEMGIVGGDAYAATQFWTDVNVKFTMTGTTDGGLEFGAVVALDDINRDVLVAVPGALPTDPVTYVLDRNGSAGGDATKVQNDVSVFISGTFGKITMGDTDGGFDWAMSELSTLTSIADDHTSHAGFSGNGGLDGLLDGQVMRYEYSFGDFAAAVSAEVDDAGVLDPILGLGVKWSGDMGGTGIALGLGYQSGNDLSIVGVSAIATMASGFRAGVNFSQFSNDLAPLNDTDHAGIMLGYTTGALSVEANYGQYDVAAVGADSEGFGLVANYDLGGGAKVMAGYGNSSFEVGPDVDSFSIGLGLSF
ncbi:MAG: porin [Paracoccaceae bacterium]